MQANKKNGFTVTWSKYPTIKSASDPQERILQTHWIENHALPKSFEKLLHETTRTAACFISIESPIDVRKSSVTYGFILYLYMYM